MVIITCTVGWFLFHRQLRIAIVFPQSLGKMETVLLSSFPASVVTCPATATESSMHILFRFVFILRICVCSRYLLFLCSQNLHLIRASVSRVNHFSISATAPVFAPSTIIFCLFVLHSFNGHLCRLLLDVKHGIHLIDVINNVIKQ